MLIVLIPIACVALLVLALMMCNLAARSDRSQTRAWAEWFAAAAVLETDEAAPGSLGEKLPIDRPYRTYRATG